MKQETKDYIQKVLGIINKHKAQYEQLKNLDIGPDDIELTLTLANGATGFLLNLTLCNFIENIIQMESTEDE